MTERTPAYRPGMVVEATVTVEGKTVRRNFFRTVYDPNPWVAQQDVRDRAYYADDDLDDVIVLYTPANANLPLHRTEAGYPRCSTCDGGGCPDCTDPA